MDEHSRGARHVRRVGRARLFAEPPARFLGPLTIRSETRLGAYAEIGSDVEIQSATLGRYCEVGPGSILGATGHPTTWLSVSAFQYKPTTWGWHESAAGAAVIDPEAGGRQSFRSVGGDRAVIGNDVWIGANVVVLRGVTIGDGCIVAANAVVTRDLPPYSVAGGVPAKVIRSRVPDDLRDELLDLRWWRFSPRQLSGVPYDDVPAAVAALRTREADLEPYEPGFIEIVRPVHEPARRRPWRRLRSTLRS